MICKITIEPDPRLCYNLFINPIDFENLKGVSYESVISEGPQSI